MSGFVALVPTAVLVALLASGCSGAARTAGADRALVSTSPAPTASTGLPVLALPVPEGAEVRGLVQVGDHRLSVHCTGAGRPTAVVLHGDIDRPGVTSADYYGRLRAALDADLRVCSYDRANVGGSDTVQGPQTPEHVVADLDGVMVGLGDRGPYLLVGQSSGGMVASAYAVSHPDRVAGIVMVDGSFDEEITLEAEGLVPPGVGPCDPRNREIDGTQSLQKIDVCSMYTWAYERRALRPEVPLVYLASRQAPWSSRSEFGPRFTRAIVPLQQSYAASWSPGRFVWVDAGHDIHVEEPDAVADAVRWVAQQHGR